MPSPRAIRCLAAAGVLAAASALAWADGADDRSITDSGTFYNALWAIGLFFILFLILGRLVWRPAMQVLQEREKLIEDHIARAEEQRKESEKLVEQYHAQLAQVEAEAAARLQQAQAQADRARQEILAAARAQAEEMARNAQGEIDAARRAAIREITVLGADLAAAVARTVLRKDLSAEDHRRLVAESLEEIRRRGLRGSPN